MGKGKGKSDGLYVERDEQLGSEQSKEVKIWMMGGKRCLLISGWVGLNSGGKTLFKFISNIYRIKPKPTWKI